MFNEMENVDCTGVCRDCVYYFEETDFCLHKMYSVIGTVENCADKKSTKDYPATTLISNEDLEFSEELTDCRDENTTISELFEELKALNEEQMNY